jgi:D-alanine transaminase
MARIAYVNGRYLGLDARAGAGPIAIEDRGYQFADGVYEVVKVVAGRPRDLDRHLARLGRSLAALDMPPPTAPGALRAVLREVWRRNRLATGLLYLQVSRGTGPRKHLYAPQMRPSLVVTVRSPGFPGDAEMADGVAVITLPDQRWGRCDVKSIGLLPNVLARREAAARGSREAWLVRADGSVTEGTSSNAYIVDRAGRLITHPTGERILAGITRGLVLEFAGREGIEVEERPFTPAEAAVAAEAALSSTSSWLLPVVAIDGQPIGEGRPGPVVRRLMARYQDHVGSPGGGAGTADAGSGWQIKG